MTAVIDPRPADPTDDQLVAFLKTLVGNNEQSLRLNWRGQDLTPGAVENAAFRQGFIRQVGMYKSGAKWTIGYIMTFKGQTWLGKQTTPGRLPNPAPAPTVAPLVAPDSHHMIETYRTEAYEVPDMPGWTLISSAPLFAGAKVRQYTYQRVVNTCRAVVPFGMYAPLFYTLDNVQEIGF